MNAPLVKSSAEDDAMARLRISWCVLSAFKYASFALALDPSKAHTSLFMLHWRSNWFVETEGSSHTHRFSPINGSIYWRYFHFFPFTQLKRKRRSYLNISFWVNSSFKLVTTHKKKNDGRSAFPLTHIEILRKIAKSVKFSLNFQNLFILPF